jgi:hypothetical protein
MKSSSILSLVVLSASGTGAVAFQASSSSSFTPGTSAIAQANGASSSRAMTMEYIRTLLKCKA